MSKMNNNMNIDTSIGPSSVAMSSGAKREFLVPPNAMSIPNADLARLIGLSPAPAANLDGIPEKLGALDNSALSVGSSASRLESAPRSVSSSSTALDATRPARRASIDAMDIDGPTPPVQEPLIIRIPSDIVLEHLMYVPIAALGCCLI